MFSVLSALEGMAPLPFSVFSIKDSEVTPIFFFPFYVTCFCPLEDFRILFLPRFIHEEGVRHIPENPPNKKSSKL